MEPIGLNEMTKAQLRPIARERGVPGFKRLTRAQLLARIKNTYDIPVGAESATIRFERHIEKGYHARNSLRARHNSPQLNSREILVAKYGPLTRRFQVSLLADNDNDNEFDIDRGSFIIDMPVQAMDEDDLVDWVLAKLFGSIAEYSKLNNNSDSWTMENLPGKDTASTIKVFMADITEPPGNQLDQFLQSEAIAFSEIAAGTETASGQCLIEAVSEASKRGRTFYSVSQILKSMKTFGIDTSRGVSISELIKWRDACFKSMTISVYDMIRRQICYSQAPSPKHSFILQVIAAWGHAYLVNDVRGDSHASTYLKDQRVHVLIGYDSKIHAYDPDRPEIPEGTNVVIVQDICDIDLLFKQLITRVNRADLIMSCDPRSRSGLTSFVDPDTQILYKLDKSFYQRKAVCESLARKYPQNEHFRFKNQGYGTMFKSLMNTHGINIPKSTYNAAVEADFDTWYPRPIIGETDICESGKSYNGVDIKKCYSRIIRRSKGVKVPVYDAFSHRKAYEGGPLESWHEYLCEIEIRDFEYQKQIVLRGDAIDKLRELEHEITVLAEYVPAGYFELTRLAEFYDQLAVDFGENSPAYKAIANCGTGTFGMRHRRKSEMFFFDDETNAVDTLQYLIHCTDYSDAQIHQYLDAFIVSGTKKTRLQEDTTPLYRYIIGAGICDVLELASFIEDADYDVVGYMTDCVYYDGPEFHELPEGYTGDNSRSVFPETEYECPKPENGYEQGTGRFVSAGAGHGKSYEMRGRIKAAIDDGKKFLVVAQTHTALNEFRSMCPESCMTVSHIRELCLKTNKSVAKYLAGYGTVFVDEFSLIPSWFMNELALAVSKNGLNACVYGDSFQVPAVNDQAPKCFFDGREFHPGLAAAGFECAELPFREGCGRFVSAEYAAALREFAETGVVPEYIRSRIRTVSNKKDMPSRAVAYTNKLRESFNKRRCTGELFGKHRYSAGDPVISAVNKEPLYNNELFEVILVSSSAMILRNDRGTFELGEEFAAHIVPAHAITVHKAQGKTFEFDYAVFTQKMYRELLYTALSRGRCLSQISLVGGLKKSYPRANEPGTMTVYDTNSGRWQFGKVYRISCSETQLSYIGETCQELEARLKEHLDDPKSAIAPMKKPVISLVSLYPCTSHAELLDVESYYIKAEIEERGDLCVNRKVRKEPKETKIVVKASKAVPAKRDLKTFAGAVPETLPERMSIDYDAGYIILQRESGQKHGKKPIRKKFNPGDEASLRRAYAFVCTKYL